MKLRLGPDLVLPDRFATEGVVATGMRGSGKSNTLVRWAEVLYEAKIPFVAVDPKGDWGGIRSSRTGKSAGLAVPVFGGLTGDFPLAEHQGAEIANLLVDHNISAVLDVSRLGVNARARFLIDFCEQLMDRHQKEPHVRCVILEEAHRYIPQQIPKGLGPKLKEAASRILLEGRAFGLGCWAATQRPARLHKDVMEEVGTVVIHRIGAGASNDQRTIAGWVKHEDLSDEIVPSLTRLGDGEAWVLSPSEFGITKRVQIDRRTTFDSGATPLVGAGSRPTLTMADIDADAIREALAVSIEKAKDNDPAELRNRMKAMEKEHQAVLRDLERQIADLRREVEDLEEAEVPVEEVEVEVVPEGLADMIRELQRDIDQIDTLGRTLGKQAAEVLEYAMKRPAPSSRPGGEGHPPARVRPERAVRPPRPAQPTRTPPPVDGDVVLKAGAVRILQAVARAHPLVYTRSQIAVLAQMKKSGGTFGTYWSNLKKAGYITEADDGAPVHITDAGLERAGIDPDENVDVLEMWRSKLKAGNRKMLDYLVANPGWHDRADLAEAIDMEPSGGTFGTYLSILNKNGLVEVEGKGDTARICVSELLL